MNLPMEYSSLFCYDFYPKQFHWLTIKYQQPIPKDPQTLKREDSFAVYYFS